MEATMKSEYAPLGWTIEDWFKQRAMMATGITDDDVRMMRKDEVAESYEDDDREVDPDDEDDPGIDPDDDDEKEEKDDPEGEAEKDRADEEGDTDDDGDDGGEDGDDRMADMSVMSGYRRPAIPNRYAVLRRRW
jgi:hypothetical protein